VEKPNISYSLPINKKPWPRRLESLLQLFTESGVTIP